MPTSNYSNDGAQQQLRTSVCRSGAEPTAPSDGDGDPAARRQRSAAAADVAVHPARIARAPRGAHRLAHSMNVSRLTRQRAGSKI